MTNMDDRAAWDELERRAAFWAEVLTRRADDDVVDSAIRLTSGAMRAYRELHANRFVAEMSEKRQKIAWQEDAEDS
jgi:hypothetical protein